MQRGILGKNYPAKGNQLPKHWLHADFGGSAVNVIFIRSYQGLLLGLFGQSVNAMPLGSA